MHHLLNLSFLQRDWSKDDTLSYLVDSPITFNSVGLKQLLRLHNNISIPLLGFMAMSLYLYSVTSALWRHPYTFALWTRLYGDVPIPLLYDLNFMAMSLYLCSLTSIKSRQSYFGKVQLVINIQCLSLKHVENL